MESNQNLETENPKIENPLFKQKEYVLPELLYINEIRTNDNVFRFLDHFLLFETESHCYYKYHEHFLKLIFQHLSDPFSKIEIIPILFNDKKKKYSLLQENKCVAIRLIKEEVVKVWQNF